MQAFHKRMKRFCQIKASTRRCAAAMSGCPTGTTRCRNSSACRALTRASFSLLLHAKPDAVCSKESPEIPRTQASSIHTHASIQCIKITYIRMISRQHPSSMHECFLSCLQRFLKSLVFSIPSANIEHGVA
jgi:hypothetical protein